MTSRPFATSSDRMATWAIAQDRLSWCKGVKAVWRLLAGHDWSVVLSRMRLAVVNAHEDEVTLTVHRSERCCFPHYCEHVVVPEVTCEVPVTR